MRNDIKKIDNIKKEMKVNNELYENLYMHMVRMDLCGRFATELTGFITMTIEEV